MHTQQSTDGWIACRDEMPPDGTVVDTKIDYGLGVRNRQELSFHRNLWWAGEGRDAMYVYYSPTHWKALEPNPSLTEGHL